MAAQRMRYSPLGLRFLALHPARGSFAGTMPLRNSSHRSAALRPRMATGSLGSRAWSFHACAGAYDSVPRRKSDVTRATVLASRLPDTVGASDCGYFGDHQFQGYPAYNVPLSNASSAQIPPPSHGWGQDSFTIPSLYDSFIHV